MNILILAAGYATRLHPLTLTKAKPLLEVAGKPMIEWVLDYLTDIPDLETVYLVTNSKFANDFQVWADGYRDSKKQNVRFKIIDDGSTDDQNKLGAIGDIHLVINQEGILDSDLLVVAGDNLFSESQAAFASFAKNHPVTLAVYDVKDWEEIKKYGNVTVNADGRVVNFVEKPSAPESTLAGIALYYYRKDVVPMINQYIEEGNNPDQPGRLVAWLYPRVETHAYPIQGIWFDIGSKENLEEANRIFTEMPQG